jgi:acetyl-CoA/propionyl-CoA carboxylase carboxyl transferase subunit
MSVGAVLVEAEVDLREPYTRLEPLFDPGTMRSLTAVEGATTRGVRGLVAGAPVFAYATDARRTGGALGVEDCRQIVGAIEGAVAANCPVIGVWHSGGARLDEGVAALDGVGRVFAAMVCASGRVAQLSVVLGPAAGGAAYGPALTDIVVMAPAGRVFVTGPDVVRSVTGEDVDMDALGGPKVHAERSGVAHVVAADEQDALSRTRRIAALAAAPGRFDVSAVTDDPGLADLLPERPNRAYNVKPVVQALLDPGTFEELHARWAPNVVVGLGRLGGRTTGVVANNPLRKGGCLDARSAEKAARFVRMCDSLGIPLVVVVDVPGYLPGTEQEWDGVVRRGAKLLHAFAESTVPRVTLVTRKSYGGAYIAMNSRSLGATAVLAWPGAEIAVMGARAAAGILHRRRLAAAAPEEREALHDRLADEQQRVAGGIARALEIGAADELVVPGRTRTRIATLLAAAPAGRGTHTNIPL